MDPLGNLNIAFTFILIFIPVNYSFKSWNQLCESFALSWVDEVKTGTQSVGSVIANVSTWFATVPIL